MVNILLNGKKGNVVPTYKKKDKQLIKNYHPISLYSICGKIFECLIYKNYNDLNATAIDLNNDLAKINDWAYQWKMNFEPDLFKQAQEVLFSRKIKSQNLPCFHFNNNPVNQSPIAKAPRNVS